MIRRPRFCIQLLCIGILIGSFSYTTDLFAASPTQELQSAVHRLTARLGSGHDADGWRRYLMLNVLESQAAKGEQADIETLQMLFQRFSTGAYGLEHRIFADVRYALQNQIYNLTNAQVGDLLSAVANARHQFVPISIQTMQFQRDQAIRELYDLRSYYDMVSPSQDRLVAYEALKIDEVTQFLRDMKFELAPEISVGKMNSMIRGVRDQRNEIIRQIDARPFENEDAPQQDANRPAPDDQVSLQELEQRRDQLNARIDELVEQRNQIRKSDAPRTRLRAKQFLKLLEYEKGFQEIQDDFADPWFQSARLSFESFVRCYYYGTSDNLQEDFLQQIDRLQEKLPELADPRQRRSAGEVGSTLEWLENAQQVSYLVAAIRARYSLPNAYVTISNDLLNQLAARSSCQSQPVRETVDGREIKGTATTRSHVTFELVDDPNQVHLSIRALANINSNTYLQQRMLTAYIGANGQAEARRSLFFNIGGLLAEEPYAAANMSSAFKGTSSKCNLINRIAEDKFSESKPDGDRGASTRVRKELLERFAKETAEPIANGKQAIAKAKTKLDQKVAQLPEIYMTSHSNQIVIVGKKSSRSTFGAGNYPANHGIASHVRVRLHDSVLSNYLDPVFSGKTYTNEELAKELEKILGEKPDTLTPEPGDEVPAEEESFSITFAKVRPIQFEFDDNMMTVVVTGERFSQADKQIRAGLKIKLRFRITRQNGKLYFDRFGKAELDYLDPEAKDAKIVAFRSFLDGRLNKKDDKIKSTKVELPQNLLPVDKIEALKDRPAARDLVLNQCRLEGGWLYLGWNYMPGISQGYAGAWQGLTVDLPAIWTETIIHHMDSTYTPN